MGHSEMSPELRPGIDTDQSACLSLQMSFGSLTAPWRTGPSSAIQASCPSQTLPQAWTGLTWLTQHGPLKVTSLVEAAGTSCNLPTPATSSWLLSVRVCVCVCVHNLQVLARLHVQVCVCFYVCVSSRVS